MNQVKIFAFILMMSELFLAGCGLSGNVKKDMQDEQVNEPPTRGGMWAERGMLNDDGGTPVTTQEYGNGGASWVSGEQADNNSRDQYRSPASESGEESQTSYSAQPSNPPPQHRNYKNGNRATRQDFRDDSKSDGSLWASDGQTNYYFSKNKTRSVGDIVTIQAEQDMVRDVGYEIQRTLTADEKELEIEDAQKRMDKDAAGTDGDKAGGRSTASSTASKDKKPASKDKKDSSGDPAEAHSATMADVDMTKSIGFKADDTIMAEIVERYPNGNYKVRGTKKVPYRGGSRIVQVLAIAKGSEIAEDDTVKSGKLYEYRLEAHR